MQGGGKGSRHTTLVVPGASGSVYGAFNNGGTVSIIQMVVIIVVVGVLLWLVNSFVPMEARIKKILNAAVIVALVVWLLITLLRAFGIA